MGYLGYMLSTAGGCELSTTHVKTACNKFSCTIKTVCNMQIAVEHGPGRPKTTWMTLTDRDLREWKLNEVDPSDRNVLKTNGRYAMRAASQLPRGEPTDVDDAPAPACYI